MLAQTDENLKDTKITGVDISKNAIDLANENKIKLNINNVEFKESDIFSNIEEKFDIIVSNPPYINKEDFEKLDNKLYYEPQNALYGGEYGLYFYKKIIKNAKKERKRYPKEGFNEFFLFYLFYF